MGTGDVAASPPSTREIVLQLVAEFGHLPDGVKLPSEHRLAERFAVSRSQIRSAVDVLAERHAVRRVHGSGTYTNRPLDFIISSEFPPSFHLTVEARGHRAKTLLVDVVEVPVPEEIAESLDCVPGEKVTRLTRIGWVDERIARCAYEWIRPEVIDEVAVALGAVESLHEVLRMGRHRPRRGRTIVSAEYPPAEIERNLELSKPVSTWTVETLTRDEATGEPLMVSRTWSRQDAVRIIVEW